MAAQNRQLKEFLYSRLYQHPSLNQERQRGAAMVAELFRIYMEHPDRLPPSYQGQTAKQPLHRVVCDYIAGMTDPFLQKTIESLTR